MPLLSVSVDSRLCIMKFRGCRLILITLSRWLHHCFRKTHIHNHNRKKVPRTKHLQMHIDGLKWLPSSVIFQRVWPESLLKNGRIILHDRNWRIVHMMYQNTPHYWNWFKQGYPEEGGGGMIVYTLNLWLNEAHDLCVYPFMYRQSMVISASLIRLESISPMQLSLHIQERKVTPPMLLNCTHSPDLWFSLIRPKLLLIFVPAVNITMNGMVLSQHLHYLQTFFWSLVQVQDNPAMQRVQVQSLVPKLNLHWWASQESSTEQYNPTYHQPTIISQYSN